MCKTFAHSGNPGTAAPAGADIPGPHPAAPGRRGPHCGCRSRLSVGRLKVALPCARPLRIAVTQGPRHRLALPFQDRTRGTWTTRPAPAAVGRGCRSGGSRPGRWSLAGTGWRCPSRIAPGGTWTTRPAPAAVARTAQGPALALAGTGWRCPPRIALGCTWTTRPAPRLSLGRLKALALAPGWICTAVGTCTQGDGLRIEGTAWSPGVKIARRCPS